MTHKPVAKPFTPVPESHIERSAERDTLNDTPELRFLRDEIEALLGSATVQRTAQAPRISYADDHDAIAPEDLGKEWLERATESEQSPSESKLPVSLQALPIDEDDDAGEEDTAEHEPSIYERDTEPSIDALLVREAVRLAGK